MDTTEGYLISGGSDGKLRVWGPELWPRRRRRSGGLRDEGASSLRLMDLTRLQETTPKPNRNRNPNPNPNRLQATLEADVCIRAIDWLGSKLVVSTLAGEALLVDYSESTEWPHLTLALQGASRLPPPGSPRAPAPLASHASAPLVACAGEDGVVRLWHVQERCEPRAFP